MKRTKLQTTALTFVAIILAPSSLCADHFSASWLESNLGIWEQDGVWSTSAYPQNGRSIPGANGQPVPGPNPTYDVVLGNSSPCTLGIFARVQTVNVLQGSTLSLGNGGYLWANTGFGNAGLITLDGPSNFSGLLRASANSNVVPGGEIFMSDRSSNSVTAGAPGKILTIDVGGRIRGAGHINQYHGDDIRAYFQIVNRGLIEAMQPVNALNINLTDDVAITDCLINEGTLLASGQSVLRISSPHGRPANMLANVRNDGGTIVASDNGTVRLERRATVTGGILATSGNGTIRGDYPNTGSGTYKDVVNTGTMVVGQNETLGLAGTFTNNGLVRLDGTGGLDTALLMRGASVVLAGNGLFAMNGGAAIAGSDFNGQTAIVGPAATIRGKGEIGTFNGNFSLKLLNLVNQGLIDATGPLTIWVDNAVNSNVTNNGGTLRASNGGQLHFRSPLVGRVLNSGGIVEALTNSLVRINSGVTLEGGTLTSSGTGVIRGGTAETGGTIKDVTNSGTVAIGATERLYLAGTLTNNGLVRFEGTANGAAPLLLRENATIGGSGLLAMGTERAAIAGAVFGTTLTVGPGATIRGNGTFGIFNSNFEYKAMRVVNQGLIESTSWLTFYVHTAENTNLTNSGTLRAGSGALLNIEQPGTVTNTQGGSMEALSGGTVRVFNSATLANYDATTQTLNGGTYFANGGTLDLNIGPILTNAATVILSGASAQFSPINSIKQNNGTLVLNNGATLNATVPAPARAAATRRSASANAVGDTFLNTGSLILGQGSSFSVNGNYSQGSNSTLEVVIGGEYPNASFHPLNVTGNAALAGTLIVKLANGFVPGPDQTFPIINAGAISGGFVNVVGATVTYGPNGVSVHPTGLTNAWQLTKAVSSKMHGSAGPFEIPLPGIECRRSANGEHTLVFTFSNTMASGMASVTNGSATMSGATSNGSTLTMPLANVPDAQELTVTLSGLTDVYSQVLPPTTVTMGVLLADANGSRRVDSGDLTRVRQQNLQVLGEENFRADVNTSGRIDSGDVTLVRKQNLQGLP